MENSVDETELNQSFRSPPRRRRSTFFERRDSIVPQAEATTSNKQAQAFTDNENLVLKDISYDRHSEEMSRYHEKLQAEKDLWKKEVNERRNKYHDLRQQYQMAAKAPGRSRISYAALSNEDIEFLKAKPNLSKLVDSQQNLHKSVLETRALYSRASELDDVILANSEDKVRTITDYILENSTVESME